MTVSGRRTTASAYGAGQSFQGQGIKATLRSSAGRFPEPTPAQPPTRAKLAGMLSLVLVTSALSALKDYCWYSWEHQKRSLERLLQFQFEYVLAGHGGSISLPVDEMRDALQSMLLRL